MDEVKKDGPGGGALESEIEQKARRIRELERALHEMTTAMEAITTPASVRALLDRVMIGQPWLEEPARSDREQLLSLLSQAPVTINVLRGPNLVFELVHPSTLRSVGERPIIGQPLTEALPELKDHAIPALLRRVLETGERVDAKEQLVRIDSDGSGELRETYFDFSFLPLLDGQGRVEGVMTFDVDVTEQVMARRALEAKDEQLRRLRARTDAGVAQAGLDGRITLTNARYRALLGRTEAELYRAHLEDVVFEPRESAGDRLRQLIETGKPFAVDARHRRPDGSLVLAQTNLSRLDDGQGRPQGVIAVAFEAIG